ncbi:MAG: alpha/beta hydrolase [Alphaproteobacteria bacterium]|nr:alpha/beta hydrolase [Alphaproteobacteria bacterium]
MHRRTVIASVLAAPFVSRRAHAADLFHRDVGRGQPIVFIHGWTLSSEIWSLQLDWLAAQGMRAVAYDRRGHGRSPKPDSAYDFDTLADDLAGLLDRLDLQQVMLVGHSMGAGEVVRYIARHGGKRIARVMLVAPTTPEPLAPAITDKLVSALGADREGYLAAGAPGLLGRNAEPELVEWALSIALQAAPQAQIACMRAFASTDFRPDMKAVTQPTLIVYGSGDAPVAALNAQRTHAAIAGSRLEIYQGAPHALFLTDTERFNRDLLQFARS